MSSAPSAWMPFYVGDYLGDTQRLTTEQHGAYLLLMLDYWRNGPPPADDSVLQQITKLDRGGWKKHKPALERMFKVTDGVWRHKRIDKEIESAAANSERRSSKAKAAAEARWGHAPSNAASMLGALPVECPPQSPSKNTVSKETDAGASSEDSDAQVWSNGKAFIKPEVKGDPGSLIGKWVRDYGKTETAAAITRAQVERPVKRIEFIEGCLRQTKRAQARQPVVPL